MTNGELVDLFQSLGLLALAGACIVNTWRISILQKNEFLRICISLKREGESRTEESPGERQPQTAEEGGESKC